MPVELDLPRIVPSICMGHVNIPPHSLCLHSKCPNFSASLDGIPFLIFHFPIAVDWLLSPNTFCTKYKLSIKNMLSINCCFFFFFIYFFHNSFFKLNVSIKQLKINNYLPQWRNTIHLHADLIGCNQITKLDIILNKKCALLLMMFSR